MSGKRKSEREKVVIVNGKKLVGLAVARRNCRGIEFIEARSF